jgi:IstB-like ATP binding protein
MLFFQLMSRRYERASPVLTSNKSFEEWGEIFGDEVMAAALIDRLLHHCHIVNVRGNSYRMRHHATTGQAAERGGSRGSAPTPHRDHLHPLILARRLGLVTHSRLSDFRPPEVSDFHPALTRERICALTLLLFGREVS